MKKLKNLILLSASLLVLLSSFAAGSAATDKISFQNKSIEYHFASIVADDLDDDFTDLDFQICAPIISQLTSSCENNFTFENYFRPAITALPCFLRIRNLRI